VASSAAGNGFGGDLVRIDAKGGDAAVIELGPGRISGEWVHVPRSEGAAEDDGWLLSLVHDADSGRGELVVLPAADPADGPVARVLLPNRVPLGFHGNWVPTPS
jgi:carotenoid cleavage dioxygenase